MLLLTLTNQNLQFGFNYVILAKILSEVHLYGKGM